MTHEEIRAYQLAQLELIKMVDELCSRLGLKYYIIGGTLLGAVRHGGFIPWDPDIDIAMPREDYEKMREYWEHNDSERYFYQHYATEKNHLRPHALIRIKDSHVIMRSCLTKYNPKYDGIYLDIFPLDYASESRKKQQKQMKKIKRLKRLVDLKAAYTYDVKSGIVKRVAKKLVQIALAPFSFTYLNRKMDNEMRRYNGNPSAQYLVSMASHYSYWKQLMPKEVYGDPVRVEFEGLSLFAPADTHNYLTRIFGDYMKLPPEDQRYLNLSIFDKIVYGSKEG